MRDTNFSPIAVESPGSSGGTRYGIIFIETEFSGDHHHIVFKRFFATISSPLGVCGDARPAEWRVDNYLLTDLDEAIGQHGENVLAHLVDAGHLHRFRRAATPIPFMAILTALATSKSSGRPSPPGTNHTKGEKA